MTPQLPAPAPNVNAETRPFWDATTEGRLILKKCRACQTVNWSFDTAWIDATGHGT
jgi:hypothetical protein